MSQSNDKPTASYLKVAVCPDHGDLAIAMFDTNDEVIAQAYVPCNGVNDLIGDIVAGQRAYFDRLRKSQRRKKAHDRE